MSTKRKKQAHQPLNLDTMVDLTVKDGNLYWKRQKLIIATASHRHNDDDHEEINLDTIGGLSICDGDLYWRKRRLIVEASPPSLKFADITLKLQENDDDGHEQINLYTIADLTIKGGNLYWKKEKLKTDPPEPRCPQHRPKFA
jgi:hypothetical protein